jgi:high-affinity iron transporter
MAIALAAMLNAALVGCGGGSKPPEDGSTGATPAPDTVASTPIAGGPADGAKVYADRCALCHGATGHGDGPASAGLDPKPRNHTDGAYMNAQSDEALLTVIRNGKGAMPAWKDVMSEDEIQAVLKHVRSLAQPPYPG